MNLLRGIKHGTSPKMLKRGVNTGVLPVLLVLLGLGRLPAETWYLDPSGRWAEISPACRDCLLDGGKYLSQNKLIKAARCYQKFLKECDSDPNLTNEVLERQFSIAERFLAGRKKTVFGLFRVSTYAEGVKMMERISDRAGNSQLGLEAAVAVARHYERRAEDESGYYEAAYLKWREIFETYDHGMKLSEAYPTGIVGKDALLAMARCKESSYAGPQYDASVLVGRPFTEDIYDNARGCYRQFKALYPDDAERFRIDERLKQIDEEIALKYVHTAQYYRRTGSRQAANLYCQMVINDWPGTKAARTAAEMLAGGATEALEQEK